MKVPLLATFLPQTLISLVIGAVTIVIFSQMHESATSTAMRNSLDGSLRYVVERVAGPFEKQRADAIQLGKTTILMDHEAYRGDGATTFPSPLDAATLNQSRSYYLQQRSVLEAANGSYQYVYQQFRTGRKPGVSSTSRAVSAYDWGWSGVGEEYAVHHVNGSHAITWSHGLKGFDYTTSDIQVNDLNITGWKVVRDYLDLSVTNNPQGTWTILDLWIDVASNTLVPGVPFAYAYPMTFDPVTGNAASLMVIDMDCAGWMTKFLRDELQVGPTEVTIIDAKSEQIVASTLTSLGQGYTCKNESEPTTCRLWGLRDPPDSRWTQAMDAIAGTGHSFLSLPDATTIIEDSDSDDIVSVRPVVRVSGLVVIAITKRSVFFSEGDTARRNAIIIAVSLLVVSLLVVVITAVQQARPLSDLGTRMEATAALKEDRDDLNMSVVSEINKMQESYLRMKGELNRVKPFLPQALIHREDHPTPFSPPVGPAHSTTTEGSTELHRQTSTVSSSGVHVNPTIQSEDTKNSFALGLDVLREETNVIASRDCVVAIVSVAYAVEMDCSGGSAALDDVFETVLDAAHTYRGVVETLTPHQIVVTFGVRSSLNDPAGEALSMALRISRRAGTSQVYTVATLLDAGSAFVGCCGNDRFRQNIVFSEDIEGLKALAIAGHRLYNQPIVATERIAPSFGNRVVMLPTDWVEWHRGGKLTIHAVAPRKVRGATNEEPPAAKELRMAFVALGKGDIDVAKRQLVIAKDLVGGHASPNASRALFNMSTCVCTTLTDLAENMGEQRGESFRRHQTWGVENAFLPWMEPLDPKQSTSRAEVPMQSLEAIYREEVGVAFSPTTSEADDTNGALFPIAVVPERPMRALSIDDNDCSFSGGRHVNNWQLSRAPIGLGAYGKVYRALNDNGSLAAVKVLPLRSRGVSIETLQKELAITSEQRHENLVGYVDARVSEEEMMVVMELMSGGSLEGIIRDFGRLPLRMVRRFTYSVLRGLGHLHRSGIVHCDIKPQNVLVGVDGVCKLADFGSALHPRIGTAAPEDAMAIGTPPYMAPEVARGEEPSAASDIWSLGMMIHELVTGKLAFNAAQQTAMKLGSARIVQMLCRIDGQEVDPQSIRAPPRPQIAGVVASVEVDAVEKFVAACLRVNPQERPTAEALTLMEFLI